VASREHDPFLDVAEGQVDHSLEQIGASCGDGKVLMLHNQSWGGGHTCCARESGADQLAAVGQVRVALGAIEEFQAAKVFQKYASHSASSLSLSRSSSLAPSHSLSLVRAFACVCVCVLVFLCSY